ncbi:sensor histidine kinase [Bacillus sp. FJAT-45037]|uniref:sensor histidine kinase n=1 Tax=Bacillus sp. FJAT-45037 TaxID=2011007 RepID=UPI000C24831B|nr:HAMP domain-containing sensor histidine kinase [Bacillus sp. FJAT-45037]
MKIRNWLLFLIVAVMLVPFLSTYFFVSYINDWYDREQLSEYVHASIRIHHVASVLKDNPRLYQYPAVGADVFADEINDDETIYIYTLDRHVIINVNGQPLFQNRTPASQLMKGMYEMKETLSHYTYKEPVYYDGVLIGFFEIKKERSELKERIDQSSYYSIAFVVTMIFLTLITTHLLIKRRMIKPITQLVSEMKAVGAGKFPTERSKRRANDEIKELMDRFYTMSGELKEVQQVKQQLVATISHDLRTPLTSIKAYAQGLEDHPEKQEEYREVIIRKANYMEKLVEDLLLYSRLEMNSLDLHCQLVDGEELAEALVDGYDGIGAQREIYIKTMIDLDTCELFCDVDRLIQVMDNLVTNALRHTPKGKSIELVATTKRELLPEEIGWEDAYVYFMIQDEGIGIATEELERIFQLFYQVDEARHKVNGKGAGLGLAISQQLIEKHGGLIGVTSTINMGSCFYFALKKHKQEGEE